MLSKFFFLINAAIMFFFCSHRLIAWDAQMFFLKMFVVFFSSSESVFKDIFNFRRQYVQVRLEVFQISFKNGLVFTVEKIIFFAKMFLVSPLRLQFSCWG